MDKPNKNTTFHKNHLPSRNFLKCFPVIVWRLNQPIFSDLANPSLFEDFKHIEGAFWIQLLLLEENSLQDQKKLGKLIPHFFKFVCLQFEVRYNMCFLGSRLHAQYRPISASHLLLELKINSLGFDISRHESGKFLAKSRSKKYRFFLSEQCVVQEGCQIANPGFDRFPTKGTVKLTDTLKFRRSWWRNAPMGSPVFFRPIMV